jgi:hypothetical protein
VVGEPADLVNAILYANEEKYFLAALSLICLVPAIGTAFGIAKRMGKSVPTSIIYKNSEAIREIVEKITPEIPKGKKVAEAVNKILSNIEIYKDGFEINPKTGELVAVIQRSSNSASSAAKQVGEKINLEWYKNPRWIDWFKKISEESLVPILNKISASEAVARYLDIYKREFWRNLRLEGETFEAYLSTDKQITSFIYSNFDTVLDNISKVKIKLSLIRGKSLGTYYGATNIIIIHLPNFDKYLLDPKRLKEEILTTIDHEVWHAIDLNFRDLMYGSFSGDKKILYNQSPEYFSDIWKPHSEGPWGDIIRNINVSNLSPEIAKSLERPTEFFVRVRALKKYIKSEDISSNDLIAFSTMDRYDLPNDDLIVMWNLLQNISDESFKKIADAIDYFY